jgi:hypothetical protein
MSVKRTSKVENLLERVRSCIESGRYLDTVHAAVRKGERGITRPEILYVLKHGYHEKYKDSYNEHYKTWDYSIRGVTLEERSLRVIVAFDPHGLLIITAIDLGA